MAVFGPGDRVRIDIPDETDPDHDKYHGRHGEVIAVLNDDAGRETGDTRDSVIYRTKLESGEAQDFRRLDLRAPLNRE